MNNQIKNNGLQTRLGHGFSKFGRHGSIWRWEFTWNVFHGHRENLQHGFDKGFLSSNADIFERLKTRFLKSVILDSKYYQKANNFKIFLCSDDKKDDKLIFTLRFFKNEDSSIESVFSLSEYSCIEFTEGTQRYFQELFTEFSLKIKNSSIPQKKINDLVQQLNGRAKTLQERYKDAINEIFAGYEYKQHFYLVTPQVTEEKELLFIFPAIANLEDIEARFSKKLLKVSKKLGYSSFTFAKQEPTQPATTSHKQEIQSTVQNLVSKFKS